MIEILDGAMGTMLQNHGLAPGACPELMNVEHPEAVQSIHEAYIEAGATIIETNTFGAAPLRLAHYDLSARAAELNEAAVRLAQKASRGRAKIAGSLGPTGRFVEPLGDLRFEAAYDSYYTQAKTLIDAGCDYLLFETFIDIQELRAGLLAAKDAGHIPIICQLSYAEDGRTVTGTDPAAAAITLEAMGASVVGVNCSLGPQEIVPIVQALHENLSIPISALPNAGMPSLVDGKAVYEMTPADFARYAPKLVEVGAAFIGGCCGTTPAHIRAMKEAIANMPTPVPKPRDKKLHLSSRSQCVVIDKDLPTRLIGERINPTGRKKLAAEIKDGSLLSVKKEAIDQTKAGAELLDVNMGVGGIDQAAAMERAVREISQIVATPLAIDTSDAKALEKGLRAYPGRALVNSVSAEKNRLEQFLPLAKKYGAAILCLPITDDGIPKDIAGKVAAIRRIVEAGKKVGLRDGDFLLDALVMTVSADKDACHNVLYTLMAYRQAFGYPATMGLSNISFGLPNRPLINATFFAMCLASGLDAPIMNPYDEKMQDALRASAALLGKDPNGLAFSKDERNLAVPKKAATAKPIAGDILASIKAAVIDGEAEAIVPLTETAIQKGYDSNTITEKALTAAMEEIGEDFGKGRLFLPQVLLSAEAMRASFQKIKELLPAQEGDNKGTVVLATVKGDVHDLGKNIVGALLANSGFTTIDLGKDVDAETIVQAAFDHQADIVGLCALMTTTMVQIDKVIQKLKEAGAKAHVIVGGAALTQEYADAAGADAYAKDGVRAVRIAKELVGKD